MKEEQSETVQPGWKVAAGIIGFIIGLVALLIGLKILMG